MCDVIELMDLIFQIEVANPRERKKTKVWALLEITV